jgi:hypothetical protein
MMMMMMLMCSPITVPQVPLVTLVGTSNKLLLVEIRAKPTMLIFFSTVPQVPLVTLVGASNELPESEELDALYDRFLLRKEVKQVSVAGVFHVVDATGQPFACNSRLLPDAYASRCVRWMACCGCLLAEKGGQVGGTGCTGSWGVGSL